MSADAYPVPAEDYRLIHSPCWCGRAGGRTVCSRDRFGQPLRAVMCEQCGCVRLDPYLSPRDASHYYARDYLARGANASFAERFEDRRRSSAGVARLRRYLAPVSRILDFGCGCGGVSNRFLDDGHRIFGHDLSEAALAHAVTTGLERHVAGASYDAVIIHHSLEHHVDAAATAVELVSLVVPGGYLLVSVPLLNRLVAGARAEGLTGEVYFPHRWYFSLHDLDRLLGGHGFRRVESDYITDAVYQRDATAPPPSRGGMGRARLRLALIALSGRVAGLPLVGAATRLALWPLRRIP